MAGKAPAAKRVPERTDERLLVEAAQKDRGRFGELYELHFEQVYAFVARRVRHRETAEDLTADVFHKALANLDRFEWRGVPFAAWLVRIAANVIADRMKRDQVEVITDDPPEMSSKPRLEQVEDVARLFRLVNGLAKDQQQVIALRFAEGKSIREIAERLGRSEGAVKQLQLRALQNLRKKFDSAAVVKNKTARRKKSGGRNG
jgi:RNA polymerase sigma-70 factor, ECF subfamily